MKQLLFIPLFLIALVIFQASPALGWYPRIAAESLLKKPFAGQIVGKNRTYILAPGEILPEIARRCRIGYNSLAAANPDVDPWSPGDWRKILIPHRTILPSGIGPGITINLAEYRLFLIWNENGRQRVRIYPIGIGQEGWNSPEGRFKITVKIESPSWTLPQALRLEEYGPYTVQPGPDNPLGKYWLGLSAPGFGIHGTDKPYGVGRRVSHGCIRLYPTDIKDLDRLASVGTPVNIVYQPIKLTRDGGTLLVQIHPDFLGRIAAPRDAALSIAERLGWRGEIDWQALKQAIREARGIPVPISKRH